LSDPILCLLSLHDLHTLGIVSTSCRVEIRDILQDQVVRVNINAQKNGNKGSVFIIVICGDLCISVILAVEFDYNVWEIEDDSNRWKVKLIALMNEGYVF
jgi:hypothetical protein